ncbi:MAG: methyltransferase domain-containing protein [Candidatus Binatia bacterium]
MTSTPPRLESALEAAVTERYSAAAQAVEPALCCPVDYDRELLAAIPSEVLERDYGCGNPSRYLRCGETALDLGSGSGKICFIASQVVGPAGRVFGVDMNDDMLALARGAASTVGARIGYANVEFLKGRIQDLALDLEALARRLQETPVATPADLDRLEEEMASMRRNRPLVSDGSIDVVLSNCVLNLVKPAEKRRLFDEVYRVLRCGGRAVISDIVSDEDVPEHMIHDGELWSGCISGALREDAFLRAFEAAGFVGIQVLERGAQPWRTVGGIEFRSMTVVAYKRDDGPCLDQGHAVIYRGPFRQVTDDDGHVLRRGDRTAVCERTYRALGREPYSEHFDKLPPAAPVPLAEAPLFPCSSDPLLRHPRESKISAAVDSPPSCVSFPSNGNCC